MYRFFVDKKKENYFLLSNEIIKHLKILRIKKDEKIICIFNEKFFLCYVEDDKAIIVDEINENHEFKNNIVLFASIINIKKFEWLVQKATELGTKEFYPLISKNTNTKYVEIIKKKRSRFEEIIKNASEQSFRNNLMVFHDPILFNNAIKFDIQNKYIAHEKINHNHNHNLNNFFGEIAFYVGPEGGFTKEEILNAEKNKIKTISLGKRILRAETASIYLLSKINIDN